MKKTAITLVILIIYACGIVYGQSGTIQLDDGYTSEKQSGIPHRSINNDGINGLTVSYIFSRFDYNSVLANGSTYQYINTQGFSKMGEPGKPALPAHDDLIALPDNAEAAITITHSVFREYPGFNIHPALQPAFDTEGVGEPAFEKDHALYNTDAFFPANITEIVEIQKLRGTPIAAVQIRPVQYNPVSGMLRVYSEITYRIDFIGHNRSFERLGLEHTTLFTAQLQRLVLNSSSIPDGLPTTPVTSQRSDYIIITTNDYRPAADSLALWKRQLGYDAEVVSKPSWSYQEVEDTIHWRYHNWFPKPDYFIILGDHGDVPAKELFAGNPATMYGTDLYLACMDGSADYYPDMAHGRISPSSLQEAQMIVDKIINYEKNPPVDSAFYNSGLNCAQYQDDNNDSFADRRFTHTSEDIRSYLMGKGYSVSRAYYTDSQVIPKYYNAGYYSPDSTHIDSSLLKSNGFPWNSGPNDIAAAINAGKFYVLHRDHGYVGGSGWAHPYFTNVSVPLLSNGALLPVIFSVNCHTGEFSRPECFSEKLQRHTTGGAIGVFAAAHASYSGYNDALTAGFFNAIWPNPGLLLQFGSGGVNNPSVPSLDPIVTMGDVMNQGKLTMRQTWSGNNNGHHHQFRLFHYFGDPAMRIWTALPATITATHVDTMFTGNTALQVSNISCNEAMVTLVYDNQIIAKQWITNTSGLLTFLPVTDTTKRLILTISKHNHIPYRKEIVIGNTGNPYNDVPCNTIPLPVKKYCNPLIADNNGATASGVPQPVCGNYFGADVWFSFIVPQSGNVSIHCDTLPGGLSDIALAAYQGSCNQLNLLACHDSAGYSHIPPLTISNQNPSDSIYVRVWSPNAQQQGSFAICIVEPDSNPYAAIPYTTGFENGLDTFWHITSSDSLGRVFVDTTCNPYAGNANLMMDISTAGIFNCNEAWLRLNTEGLENLTLRFWWREYGDENHAMDGVFISDDGGDNFIKIIELQGDWLDWTQYVVDLDQYVLAYGLKYTNRFVIKFQQYDNWYYICSNPAGGDGFAFDEIAVYVDSAVYHTPIPYFTGFDNGFDNSWRIRSSKSKGRIVATQYHNPFSGTGQMIMDVSSGGSFITNEALLHLDLTGQSNVSLSFWWKDINDESHSEDGVFFSDDNGETFVKVSSLHDTAHTWMQKSLNISKLCNDYNIQCNNNFVIKFQQYDDYSIFSDGIAIDHIVVDTSKIPMIAVEPYALSYYTDTGKTSTQTFAVLNPGTDTLFVHNVTSASPFLITPTLFSVLPGDTIWVDAVFTPDSVKEYHYTVKFHSNAWQGNDSLKLSGLGRHRRLYSSCQLVDFDTILRLSRDTLRFDLITEGNDNIRVNNIFSPARFKILSNTSFTVKKNDTVWIEVEFWPTAEVTYNGTIIIESDANTIHLPVTGTGGSDVAIDETALTDLVNIWPNPANSVINIQLNTPGSAYCKLLDATGRTMQALYFFNNTVIDIGHLSKGYYLLNIITAKGEKISKPIIID